MLDYEQLTQIQDVPVVIADRQGIITYVNARFLRDYAWSEDIVGKSLVTIIPVPFHDSHNLGHSRFLLTEQSRVMGHPLRAMVLTGDGQAVMSEHTIVAHKTGDDWVFGATLRPIDAPMEVELRAEASPAGQPPGSRDGHLVAVDELRATMGRMEIALGAADEPILWTDDAGAILWCNEAFDRLTARDHLPLLGCNIREVLPLARDGAPVAESDHPIVLAGEGGSPRGEYEYASAEGRLVLEVVASPFRLKHGQSATVVVIHDVTLRREMMDTLRAAKARMEEELNVARDIQMSMLPLTFPAFPERDDVAIHAALKPAREVGGDFYDFFFLDERHLCFCVGDVSGKGVPAALFMAVSRTLIRAHAATELSPGSIVTLVNEELSAENPNCMFVTLFLGVLDVRSGKCVYTNAGHNPPYRYGADRVTAFGGRHGPVVGAMEGLTYGEDTVELAANDALLVFTDGVTEAANGDGLLLGEARLEAHLHKHRAAPVQVVVDETMKLVEAFEAGTEQSDDVTLLALRLTRAEA